MKVRGRMAACANLLARLLPGKTIAGIALVVALVTPSIQRDSVASPEFSAPRHSRISLRRNSDGNLMLGPRNSYESYNWSGYALDNYRTGQTYTSASASWTVPKVTFKAPPPSCHPISAWGFTPKQTCITPTLDEEYSSTWVGIGGDCEDAYCSTVDNTLIQLGTEQRIHADGTTDYYAWTETLPAFESVITTTVSCATGTCTVPRTVQPGDSITASLVCQANCTLNPTQPQPQTWLLTMTDATQNWTYSTTISYLSTLASADWIQEAPSSSAGILPLAQFDPVTFKATANGQTPALKNSGFGSVGVAGITMINSYGQTSTPSAVVGLGFFSACWGDNMVNIASCAAP